MTDDCVTLKAVEVACIQVCTVIVRAAWIMLSNILLSRLSPIIGDHQCGFQHNRSTTDQIFCIRQILEKKYD
jgi:hypothetical protein